MARASSRIRWKQWSRLAHSATLSYSSTSWGSASVTLTGVSGAVGITFDTNANRKNERGYVDDVLVQ